MFENLVPKHYACADGSGFRYFVSSNLPLVKLDFTFEAGSRYQDKKCQAAAANRMLGKACAGHSSAEVAEFMDFRGIVLDRAVDDCTASLSIFFLRQYAGELFPLLRCLLEQPEVPEQAFTAHVAKRRMQLLSGEQKTSVRARNAFYLALFGPDHPLGSYAVPDDADRLTIDDVRRFISQRYSLSQADILLSGDVDEELLALVEREFGGSAESRSYGITESRNYGSKESWNHGSTESVDPPIRSSVDPIHITMPQAVQSTIRVGRVLPFAWDSEDCAFFSMLNTLLGGYFGSRLMTNLREDKGYTYGIYSQMQIYRGVIVFFITADVAAESTRPALHEIMAEVERLRDQPVPADELQRVCSYMRGDFLRSIDGVFDISERYRQMVATGCDERFTQNYFEALRTATPELIQRLAQQFLDFRSLTTVIAGPADNKQ